MPYNTVESPNHLATPVGFAATVPTFSPTVIRISFVIRHSDFVIPRPVSFFTFSRRIEASLAHIATNCETTDFYVITALQRKITQISSFSGGFGLSDIACIWYKNRTHILSRMNTSHLGPIIEVASQPSEVGGQNETRVSPETKTAIHPFGSALLRLELALSLICVRRRQACPTQARTKTRRMG